MDKTSRLTMLDEHGDRRAIIPAEVTGYYRSLRNQVHLILFAVFLLLPWIEVNGRQLILLDIPNRRFEIFGQLFLAHDSPILFFLIAIFAVGLMLTTALWGRVWCGWACPQTVFIDAVYRRIEKWIEGPYLTRIKLAQSSMTVAKFLRLTAKWVAFVGVSSLFAHSFLAYFTGGKNLLSMISDSPSQNWNYFLMVSFTTALLSFNFGWFREQFCIIMCPYGRFQNVLMDSQSLNITYDRDRGEPRKGLQPTHGRQGDCVDCNRCVRVCPTGIDIRNGLQLECINCTACIDACDEIMTRVKKPTGLISYRAMKPQEKIRFFRPRILAYLSLLGIFVLGLTYSLHARLPYSMTVLRAKDTPYEVSPDGQVLNHFRAHILNQSHRPQKFVFRLDPDTGATLTQAIPEYDLKPGESREIHLFIHFPQTALDSLGKFRLHLRASEKELQEEKTFELQLVGPIAKR